MNIQLKPIFELHEKIVIPISDKVPDEILNKHLITGTEIRIMDIEVRKVDEGYAVIVYDLPDPVIYDGLFIDMAPWIDDAHFIIYYRHPERATFYKLEITEIKIENGKYYRKDIPFKTAIPSCRFLKLEAGGVQQMFDLPHEYLFDSKAWESDPAVQEYLIADIIFYMDNYCKTRNPEDFKPSLIEYGAAFLLNKGMERLKIFNYTDKKTQALIDKVKQFQEIDRNLIIKTLKEKIAKCNEIIPISEIKKAEEKLGIKFPPIFKQIYSEIGNGSLGPGDGFLPLSNNEQMNIISLILELRKKYKNLPYYVIPILNRGGGVYTCLDCSTELFPVVSFYSKKYETAENWYDVIVQDCESFEAWLDNWMNEIFPECYEVF